MSTTLISPLVAVLAFMAGPLVAQFGAGSRHLRAAIDGFAIAAVGGITLLVIAPGALAQGGWVAAVFLGVGVTLPALLHRIGHGHTAFGADRLLMLALVLHALVESAALATARSDQSLALAIAAHRVPLGLAVFMLASNRRTAWAFITLLIVATLVGYGGGQLTLGWLTEAQNGALQGFVAGSLIHAVVGHSLRQPREEVEDEACHHHDHGHDHPVTSEPAARHSPQLSGTIGALAGVLLVFVVLSDPHDHHQSPFGPAFFETFRMLALQSAPALVIGYLLAGLLSAMLGARSMQWLSGGSRIRQSAKGIAFGLPLPICSCGVLPVYQTLVKHGVPATAGIAFLIATPELGIDALLLSWPLLGPDLTIARLLAALGVAFAVSMLLGRFEFAKVDELNVPLPTETTPFGDKLRRGLRFGFGELFDHTMPWIIAGLLVASLIEPLLSGDITEWIPNALQVPLLTLVSIPAYVCASGSTPIAAIAVQNGISSGAAMAFLIAGPATNITTFGILSRLINPAFALKFGLAVAVMAMLAGWTVDLIGIPPYPGLSQHHHDDPSVLALACVALLSVLFVASSLRQGPRGILRQIVKPFS